MSPFLNTSLIIFLLVATLSTYPWKSRAGWPGRKIVKKKILFRCLTHHNFAHELSRFTRSAHHAESWLVSDGLALLVHADQGDGIDEGQEDGGEAHAAGLGVDVEDVRVSLGGSVELSDEPDSEPVLELLPDARPQPVAPHDLNIVAPVLGRLGSWQQIPADLAYILGSLWKTFTLNIYGHLKAESIQT